MSDSEQPVVLLEEVAKTYRSGDVEVLAVRGVTMQIRRGEIVALMGSKTRTQRSS